MRSNTPRTNGSRPRFTVRRSSNPSGVPRRQIFTVVALGIVLGSLGGIVASNVTGTWGLVPWWVLVLGIASGTLGGATIGALGVVMVGRVLDRRFRGGDQLVGYSGVIRMLLYAGELSFLGAIAGGIGGGIGGTIAGLLGGALSGSILGGIIYRVRGLGMVLGVIIGIVTGGIGGAIGGTVGSLIGL